MFRPAFCQFGPLFTDVHVEGEFVFFGVGRQNADIGEGNGPYAVGGHGYSNVGIIRVARSQHVEIP